MSTSANRNVCLVVAALLTVTTACGADPDRGAGKPPNANLTSTPATDAGPRSDRVADKTTPCDEVRLPDEGVGEADYSIDPSQGLLGMNFSDTRRGVYRNVSYSVRYLEDPTCRTSQEVAELIARVHPPGWFPSASQCPLLSPHELPDGSSAKAMRPGLKPFMSVWGRGSNRVSVGRGYEVVEQYGAPAARFPRTGGEPVVGTDAVKRWVIAVGDPPLGQITYLFVVHGCPYVLWTNSGLTRPAALDYASRLSTWRATAGDAGRAMRGSCSPA